MLKNAQGTEITRYLNLRCRIRSKFPPLTNLRNRVERIKLVHCIGVLPPFSLTTPRFQPPTVPAPISQQRSLQCRIPVANVSNPKLAAKIMLLVEIVSE
jgi:hypothetical protein